MLNNIKISQTTNEIVLNINVIADIEEICEELKGKILKLKEFYQTAETPIRVTGKLFTEGESERIKKIITSEIDVEVNFDDASDLLGLHAIKKTFQTETEVTEGLKVTLSLNSAEKGDFVIPYKTSSTYYDTFTKM